MDEGVLIVLAMPKQLKHPHPQFLFVVNSNTGQLHAFEFRSVENYVQLILLHWVIPDLNSQACTTFDWVFQNLTQWKPVM